jgi:hypothetical protein
MSNSAQTRSNSQLNSIEAIEERLAMIENMQRILEKAARPSKPTRKPRWLH